MKFKRESTIYLVLLLLLLTSFIANGVGIGEETETAFTDVTNLKEVEGVIEKDGIFDITALKDKVRIKDPIEESVRTPKGDILNAKLEDSIFSSGDFVNGKIESFADNNLIPIQSIADPDLSINLLMGKDGKATVEQYDGYESAPLCFASRSLPFARVLSLALWR